LTFNVAISQNDLDDTVSYEVTGPNSFVFNGTFGPLANGGNQDLVIGNVPPGDYTISFVYGQDETEYTATVTCVEPTSTPTNTPTNTPTSTPTNTPVPPSITVTGQCSEAERVLVFIVSNNGGALPDVVQYQVTGPNGYSSSGTFGPLGVASSATIDLGSVAPGDYTINFVYGGQQTQYSTTVTCIEPTATPTNTPTATVIAPSLTGSGQCIEDDLAFTITNNGGTRSTETTYTVLGPQGELPGGTVPALEPNTSTQTILFPNTPPGTYTLFTGDQSVTVVVVCNEPTPPSTPPSYTGSGVCAEGNNATFTITNNGGSASSGVSYSIFTPSGQIDGTTEPLASGQSATITTTGDQAGTYVLFTEDGSVTVQVDCLEPPVCVYPYDSITSDDSGNDDGPGFPVIDTSVNAGCYETATPREWTPVEIGSAVCPDWLVYHTNMTGDWEIFRLGELPDEPDAEANLTQGVGDRVSDVSPARSPDSEWIAFTSSRDGNWELYIGRTNGSEQRRVTVNNFAIDTSPAWSPLGNSIAFQSNRDGNWNIYLVDLATGAETALTADSLANEIHPSWSPDGTKVVYQSDRDGFWQIYELNVLTGEEVRLSDGTGDDHDPLYSNDGEHIAFRSFRDGGDNSVIYTMEADGENVVMISDPNGDARNHAWSADDELIAYNSDLDGDQDIYIYEVATERTRLLTDNNTTDKAPTWLCDGHTVVWTSDATEDPDVAKDNDIYSANADPITAPPIDVVAQASQLTSDPGNDRDPQNTPPIELSSRNTRQVGEERNR
jgi:TolB protein